MTDFIRIFNNIMQITLASTDYGIGKIADTLFWIARAVVIAVGGDVGIVKIVKGKSDENPKDMNEGLAALGATGVIFAATFAIQAIF